MKWTLPVRRRRVFLPMDRGFGPRSPGSTWSGSRDGWWDRTGLVHPYPTVHTLANRSSSAGIPDEPLNTTLEPQSNGGPRRTCICSCSRSTTSSIYSWSRHCGLPGPPDGGRVCVCTTRPGFDGAQSPVRSGGPPRGTFDPQGHLSQTRDTGRDTHPGAHSRGRESVRESRDYPTPQTSLWNLF